MQKEYGPQRRLTPERLLIRCLHKGIHLSMNEENGLLHVQAPHGVVNEKLKAELREYKPQLLALLREAQRQEFDI